jgi:competence protein ComEC
LTHYLVFIGRHIAISHVLAMALLLVVVFDPWAVNALNTQWVITLAFLPLLIFMCSHASIVSLLANAFAIPVISFLVVLLAILGSLLHLDFIIKEAHFALGICMQGLHMLATFPT